MNMMISPTRHALTAVVVIVVVTINYIVKILRCRLATACDAILGGDGDAAATVGVKQPAHYCTWIY